MTRPGSYFGGNATRASVVHNPAAYANDQKSGLFGVREFRKFGFASEGVRDAAADKIIAAGYTNKKNPVCPGCFTRKATNGACNCG